MSELELALRELESATAALATTPVDDFAETRAAMDRRAWAIRDLAALTQRSLPASEREDALQRLAQASAAGRQVEQRLIAMRSAAAMEWSHWGRIYRALGASPKPVGRVDYSG